MKFPMVSQDVLRKYKGDRSWSEYYIKDLRKINPSNAQDYLKNGSKEGRLDHVIIALGLGANINADDDLALRWASEYGHLEVIKYLLEKGANIHAKDDYALRWASKNGHLEVVNYLQSVIVREN